MKPNRHLLLPAIVTLAALAAPLPALAGGSTLTAEDAIRAAWAHNPALLASASGVEAARADAARARDARLPTLRLEARGVRTDEPVMAFGLKLDQVRITAEDFDPAKLNAPEAVGGLGASATISVPVYLGGRLAAGQRAVERMAESEADEDQRRRMELTAAVVEAYFGAQAAELGIRYAEDQLAHARGGFLPSVFAQASAETMWTPDLEDGARWTAVGVVIRWDLSLADRDATRAAAALEWRRRQAAREVDEARASIEAAAARVLAAREALTASESARTIREARHREGLLPLTDVLDAEAALAGARALLLASRLEARVARASLALALHQPIEGMLP